MMKNLNWYVAVFVYTITHHIKHLLTYIDIAVIVIGQGVFVVNRYGHSHTIRLYCDLVIE